MTAVRIFKPSKTAMQSGRRNTKQWILEYEQASRREPDPLMGWSSAHDTLNEVRLHFATLEEAITFAEKHGLNYSVITPQPRTEKQTSYADNFRYDRIRI